jgi:hypothetical protein
MKTSTKRLLRDFLVEGFLAVNGDKRSIRPEKKTYEEYKLYKDKQVENFITPPPPEYKFHDFAYSLMSSQVFAYNLMSGIDGVKFELEFKTLQPYKNIESYPAQVDAMIVRDNVVRFYEVKAFELDKQKKDAIFEGERKKDIERANRYFAKECYFNQEFAEQHFIPFLVNVQNKFRGKTIYAGGIKQLCCHLLGIINCLDEAILRDKKIELYAMCFDNMKELGEFENWLESYKRDLEQFGKLANEFLEGYDCTRGRVRFCGYVGAFDFVKSTSMGDNYEWASPSVRRAVAA